MEFEWDERKRLATLAKHGIDFRRACDVFLADHVIRPARSDLERRFKAIGVIDETEVTVIFTRRGEAVRIISARRAKRRERREYRAIYD